MWCKRCRQDVPGVGSPAGQLCCLRCGAALLADEAASTSTDRVAKMAAHGVDLTQPPVTDVLNQWQLDRDVRQIRKLAGPLPADPAGVGSPRRVTALNAPHASARGPHFPMAAAPAPPAKQRARSGALVWAILSPSLTAFVCGAVLLAWSLVAQRTELWSLGLPIAVCGQVGLLMGFILQLERVWQGHRDASAKLDAVDTQLHDLRHSTSLLRVNHGSAAQAFYAHMADGANPEILLADLKGQLDLLAVTMAERRSA